MFIGLVCWVALGLTLGFIVSKMIKLRGDAPMLGILAAALGAVLAGFVFGLRSDVGVGMFNPTGLLFALAGGAAAAAVAVWHSARAFNARAA